MNIIVWDSDGITEGADDFVADMTFNIGELGRHKSDNELVNDVKTLIRNKFWREKREKEKKIFFERLFL